MGGGKQARRQEETDFQEVIRLKNAVIAAESPEERDRLQKELIEKIDRWFQKYRPTSKA